MSTKVKQNFSTITIRDEMKFLIKENLLSG